MIKVFTWWKSACEEQFWDQIVLLLVGDLHQDLSLRLADQLSFRERRLIEVQRVTRIT